jgi:hypothetical protein
MSCAKQIALYLQSSQPRFLIRSYPFVTCRTQIVAESGRSGKVQRIESFPRSHELPAKRDAADLPCPRVRTGS